MSELTGSYRAIDPEMADALERFGVITPAQADANLERFYAEWEHYQALWESSRTALKALPRRERPKFYREFDWRREWVERHDPLGSPSTLAQRRMEARQEEGGEHGT